MPRNDLVRLWESSRKIQDFKELIRQVITNAIGEGRPFMDVPDVTEEIAQTIMLIIEQSQSINDSQEKEVIVMVKSGIVEIEKAPPGTTVTVRDYDIQEEPELGFDYEESIFEF